MEMEGFAENLLQKQQLQQAGDIIFPMKCKTRLLSDLTDEGH